MEQHWGGCCEASPGSTTNYLNRLALLLHGIIEQEKIALTLDRLSRLFPQELEKSSSHRERGSLKDLCR